MMRRHDGRNHASTPVLENGDTMILLESDFAGA